MGWRTFPRQPFRRDYTCRLSTAAIEAMQRMSNPQVPRFVAHFQRQMSLVERIVLKHVPKTSRHVPNTFPKIIQFPKLWGSMSQTCPKRQTFPKLSQTLSQRNSQNRGFPKCPRVSSQALPKTLLSQTCHKRTSQRCPKQRRPVVSRSGPRGSNSNMVQRSRNNNGIACTHRAFSNTARAKYYCWGIYTGDTPKMVRWEKASEFGSMDTRQGLACA
jgi:hypothetical protein